MTISWGGESRWLTYFKYFKSVRCKRLATIILRQTASANAAFRLTSILFNPVGTNNSLQTSRCY